MFGFVDFTIKPVEVRNVAFNMTVTVTKNTSDLDSLREEILSILKRELDINNQPANFYFQKRDIATAIETEILEVDYVQIDYPLSNIESPEDEVLVFSSATINFIKKRGAIDANFRWVWRINI